MDQSRLAYKVFRWSFNLAVRNYKNWAYRVIKHFRNFGIDYGIKPGIDKRLFVLDTQGKAQQKYEQKWLKEMQRNTAKYGDGGSKLRLYRSFKKAYKPEPYVTSNLTRLERASIAKFRSGTAPIAIELGQYQNLPIQERVCFRCRDVVEAEVHVLLHCPLYTDIRIGMLRNICEIVGNTENLNDEEMAGLILADSRCVKVAARACKSILESRRKMVLA